MNSTVNLLDEVALKYGNKIAYEDEWESISFLEFKKRAMIIAQGY